MEADFNPGFLRPIFPRIEYKALREAVETLGAASFSEVICLLAVHLFRVAHSCVITQTLGVAFKTLHIT